MEEKINIAEILKNKPQGTKLYNLLYNIDVELDTIVTTGTKTIVWCTDKIDNNDVCHRFYSEFGTIEGYPDGLQILLPSKEMRDWSKFAWKKGDVLVNSRGLKILFDRWANGNYTSFYAKTINLVEDGFLDTNLHTLASEKEAKSFIKCIEERFGGKLNLQTLEIQKQPEFKDGDIVAVDLDRKNIRIFKEKKNGNNICWGKYYIGFSFNNEGKRIQTFKNYTADCSSDRLATDSEKQQLFSALEKEGKAWDSEHKMIVDLKPKVEFKPMDLCLMKYIGRYNNRGWELCQYAYTEHRVSSSGEQRDFYHAVGGEIYAECIPYKGNEHLLGTKKSK